MTPIPILHPAALKVQKLHKKYKRVRWVDGLVVVVVGGGGRGGRFAVESVDGK